MTAAELHPAEDGPEEEADVDVDLDLISDALRREAVGEPTTVRIDGQVIHIAHASDWSSTAMQAAAGGNWENWASEVIESREEYQVWLDADLHNFQIEAVFDQCARQARLSMGKSRKRSGSRSPSRRR